MFSRKALIFLIFSEPTKSTNNKARKRLPEEYRRSTWAQKPDEKFHQLIVGTSGNRKLAKIYGDLHSHMGIERLFYEDEDKALKELNITLSEHTAVVEAFSKKDKERIKKKVRDHLENVKRRILLGINSEEERR